MARAVGGIVWAHNTHVGDARATSMGVTGEVNIGQIVRQQIGPEHVFILGFGTGTGQVLAASNWESEVRTMTIPNPPQGTLEGLLMALGEGDRLWMFHGDSTVVPRIQLPHRAIGVLYHPEHDHQGNFVPSRLDQRYDAFIFLPQTTPLRPLHSGLTRQ